MRTKTHLFCQIFTLFAFAAHAQIPADTLVLRKVDSLLAVVKAQVAEKKYALAIENNTAAEALAIETFGRHSLPYANCCLRHAHILHNQWNKTSIQEAVRWATEALEIRQKILGRNHIDCVRCLGKLAAFHTMLQEHQKAQAYGLEARNILEQTNQTNDSDYSIILNNLAGTYSSLADYAQAESIYFTSKQHMEKNGQKESTAYVQVLSQLANLNLWVNNFPQALQYAQEAAGTYQKVGSETDTYYAFCLRNMAQANMGLKNYAASEKQLLNALEVVEKSVGKSDFRYADILSLCAILYNKMRAFDKAIPMQQESIELLEKSRGKNDIQYSVALSDLANSYMETGQIALAEPLLLEAVAIQDSSTNTGQVTMNVVNKLGAFYRMTGRFDLAESVCQKIAASAKPSTLKKVSYMSETELQEMLRHTYLSDNTYSLAYIMAAEKVPTAAMAGLSYDNALFYKGFLQQSAIRARQLANAHPNSRADLDSLNTWQDHLGKLFAMPKDERNLADIDLFTAKTKDMQKKIAREIAGYDEATQQVHWPEVQKNLRNGEACIEFVRFEYYNRSATFPTDSVLYIALVLRPDTESPQFVALFEERDIAPLFKNKGSRKSEYVNRLYTIVEQGAGQQKSLYQAIWQPLETKLTGVNTVYFSPAGLLHRINFDAIADQDGKPLADRFQLLQLGSTRQLALPPTPPKISASEASLFGGIDYEIDSVHNQITFQEPKNAARTRGDVQWADTDSTLRGGSWGFLPSTEKEVATLQPMLRKAGLPPTLNKGADASEEVFKNIGATRPSPRVLHLATHGFFFPDPQNMPAQAGNDESAFKRAEHPMIRSGLILAGGNYAWKTGHPVRPDREDGILTAYEISQMDLSNTELVVLSACETGLGDIEGQEGVYGLQRAFKVAGAKHLIMSLWQVPDIQTQELMTAFYRYWLTEKRSIPEAFRAAQREMRAKYEHPFFWAGFILLS